jgi:H+/Cl- antiporter ClcA
MPFFGKKKKVTVIDEENKPIVQEAEETLYGSAANQTKTTVGDDSSLENFSVSIAPSNGSSGDGLGDMRLHKTKGSFWEDARSFEEGTIPQSVVLAIVIGIICGVAAFIYYTVLEFLLDLVWKTIPEKVVIDVWPESSYWWWIVIASFTMCIGVGLTVVCLGDPGDLPYTIKCVHEKGYISMGHVPPMVLASMFSIVGGGSLGPEAPLVAICAALGGFISRRVFKQNNRNVVRKHTLMGMAGALAAFFGCPLGGSLFALEVNSRFGVEYFEHIVESILCGEVCVCVFRALAGIPIESIWDFYDPKLPYTTPSEVLLGCALGLVGALVAFFFASMHWGVMAIFAKLDVLRDDRAIYRGLIGGIVIVLIGITIPHTMFWGESEFQTIASLSPASTLPHVWPTSALGIRNGFYVDMLPCGSYQAHRHFLHGCRRLPWRFHFSIFRHWRCARQDDFFFDPRNPCTAGCALHGCINQCRHHSHVHRDDLDPMLPFWRAVCTIGNFGLVPCLVVRHWIHGKTLILLTSCSLAFLGDSQLSTALRHLQPFIKTQIARNDLENSLFFNPDEQPLIDDLTDS